MLNIRYRRCGNLRNERSLSAEESVHILFCIGTESTALNDRSFLNYKTIKSKTLSLMIVRKGNRRSASDVNFVSTIFKTRSIHYVFSKLFRLLSNMTAFSR